MRVALVVTPTDALDLVAIAGLGGLLGWTESYCPEWCWIVSGTDQTTGVGILFTLVPFHLVC